MNSVFVGAIRAFVFAAASIAVSAQAAPVTYEGTLVPGVTDSGNVGGFSLFLNQAGGVEFWSFTAAANESVTFAVNRLNGNLDPGLSFYRGTTSADGSLFNAGASWGGLTFVGSLDDEAPPFKTPGPNGDPFGSFAVTAGQTYTVAIGGNLSTDAGTYPYQVKATVAAAVPEPSIYAMMSLGVAALAFTRRRLKKTS